MKKAFLGLLIIICVGNVMAQSGFRVTSSYSDAENEIREFRQAIISDIENNYLNGLSEYADNKIIVQLTDNYNDTIPFFSKREKFLMWYMSGLYKPMLSNYEKVIQNDDHFIPEDSLFTILARYGLRHREHVFSDIDQNGLKNKQMDFLKLYYNYLIANSPLTVIHKEEVINQGEQFISTYPESKWHPFINDHMLLRYKKSNIGIGFSLTGGYMMNRGSLKDYFGNSMPVGGGFNFSYSRFRLDLSFTGSFISKIQSGFEYNGTWDEGTRYTQATGAGNIGFELIHKEKYTLYPYGGFTTTTISSFIRNQNGEEINAKLGHFPGYDVGIAFEKRFIHNRNVLDYEDRFIMENSRTYWNLKVKAGILFPGFENEDQQFAGEMFYLKLTFGILTVPALFKTSNK